VTTPEPTEKALAPVQQPFLHELVSCIEAPTAALSGPDGQIRPSGAQGVFRYDHRVLSTLVVDLDGHEPVPIGNALTGAGGARFTGVVRHLGDPGADPTVWLERDRRVRSDGVDEELILVNAARVAISTTIRVRAGVDLAGVGDVKHAATTPPLPSAPLATGLSWADTQTRVLLRTSVTPTIDRDSLSWTITVPARSRWTASLTLDVSELANLPNSFRAAPRGPGWETVSVDGPPELARLVNRGVGDVQALTLADPLAPDDVFVAGGSPWFFTLFGRDSIWAAQLTLPLGTDLARGTLRTLARRQGTRHDPETAEAPGKILHEVRTSSAHSQLPPTYFGSVDATALWVCLLHDAWRWGMDPGDVADLLDPLEAALGWLLTDADQDGDGLLEYVDLSGHGLANQGWKDSGDSIQFPDGAVARPPIALSEAQAYAYQAAMSGAVLLEEFGRVGADRARAWAIRLRDRFRGVYWVSDRRGRFPAIALDGTKEAVPTATSNLGHVLGTGLIDPAEAAAVASRLAEPDLDAGYGLRTMSADAAGFNPLGYHAGTIWPHDTVIAIRGLVAEGHPEVAASLAFGLLRAAASFDHRLPELFAGTDGRAGEPVLAYPASCRPQAWSAGVPVALLQTALGLAADVPRGVLRVHPHQAFSAWFPLKVSGLRVAGHPLTVTVDARGRAVVETDAPLDVEVTS
jgi:hypothetical protein